MFILSFVFVITSFNFQNFSCHLSISLVYFLLFIRLFFLFHQLLYVPFNFCLLSSFFFSLLSTFLFFFYLLIFVTLSSYCLLFSVFSLLIYFYSFLLFLPSFISLSSFLSTFISSFFINFFSVPLLFHSVLRLSTFTFYLVILRRAHFPFSLPLSLPPPVSHVPRATGKRAHQSPVVHVSIRREAHSDKRVNLRCCSV